MSAENPLAPLSDDELVGEHSLHRADSHYLTEMLRRYKIESASLGKTISRLNKFLLAFTVALCLLTVPLVLVEVGVMKRPQERAAGGSWVLWQITIAPEGGERWGIPSAFTNEEGGKSACESSRIKREEESKKQAQLDFKRMGKAYISLFTCLPDSINPREPKGK